MTGRDRPNVVLISMDATRADHLSCYGYGVPTTPNLDRFAEGSVLYERDISPACWTLPSHASMFTGLHPTQHGTHFDSPVLHDEVRTLAEVLGGAGYQTVGFPNNAWLANPFGFHRGFETYWLRQPLADRISRLTRFGSMAVKAYEKFFAVRNGRLSRKTVQWTQRWFDGAFQSDKPFFLFALFGDPHLPHYVHPSTERILGDRLAAARRVNQDPHRYIAGKVKMTDGDFELLKGLYDGEIAYMDERIGDFLDVIGTYVPMENTLVIITSDHGENLGDHGLMAHQYCLYDTLLHVPLIIHYPSFAGAAGKRVDGQVQGHEIFTTVMDVVGASREGLPNDLRGRCLLPETVADNPLPFTVSEELAPNFRRIRRLFPDYDCTKYDRRLRSLRTDRYKYIWASDGRHELYDLAEDPGESRNLVEAMPGRARAMEEQLDAWTASVGAAAGTEAEADFDDSIVERLKGLGYL